MTFRVVCIVLIALIIFSGNKGLVYWLEYKLNYEFIVRNLCVERDKPNNSCKGCCHLKSNLQKDGDGAPQNKSYPLPVKNRLNEAFQIFFLELEAVHLFNIVKSLPFIPFKDELLENCKEPQTPPPKILIDFFACLGYYYV